MTMNSNNLTPISDLATQRGYQLQDQDLRDVKGQTAYGANGEKIGTVRDALAETDSGRIRYLVVDAGGWFSAKQVLVPVGLARFENDGVYFNDLTKDQVKAMREYRAGESWSASDYAADESVLRGRTVQASGDRYDYRDSDTTDRMFKSPQRLQLLEERLVVDKRREKVGEVEIGKRVETQQQRVDVDLSHDEVIIERHPVTDGRTADAGRLGADSQTIRVDVEAERADVRKQAYVAEEVEVSKKQETRHETFNEQVGREVLEVERTGELRENPNDDDATGRRGRS